jgi:ectoine hydroxylase-related dioxygenase (phytanoyl-CoA dioxygenase family)
VSVSDEVRAAFAQQGFVVAPDLLTDDELAMYGAAVDAAVERRQAHDSRTLDEKTRYEQSFQQCLNLWEDCPAVAPLTFHPRLAEAAAQLLDIPSVRIWHDQALYKEAGGKGTDAHQDQPYWPIEETDTVTAWIPFQDVRAANGAMHYVPGSHRFGLRKFSNIFFGEGFDLERGEEARGVSPVTVELDAGSVAFHHGLTIHGAASNTSDAPRRVHTVIYFADGSHRTTTGQPHQSVDRAGIEPGAVIVSSATPVAWPSPATLPEPPPPLDPPSFGWAGWGVR